MPTTYGQHEASASTLRVALLTPPGPGGIAVVRLSGDGCLDLVAQLCRPAGGRGDARFAPGRLSYCRLMDGDEPLDEVIVSPIGNAVASAVEICLHGGVRVVQRAIMLFQRLGAQRVDALPSALPCLCRSLRRGARDSRPEDLPDATTIAGVIDAWLPRAITRRMARFLVAQRQLLPPMVARLREDAAEPLSPDERADLHRRSAAAHRALHGIRIALIGPPNAGKSTLANTLIGRERVITSDAAGTTRDWVEETALLDGWPVMLTDTAGARPSDDPLETEAIARGLSQAHAANLVLCVFDVRTVRFAPGVVDEFVRAHLPRAIASGLHPDAPPESTNCPPLLVAFNMADLDPAPPPTTKYPSVFISALSTHNVGRLEQEMSRMLELDLIRDDVPTAF